MRPEEFRHVLRAVASATGHDQFVVVGSQAILGSVDDPPETMLESMEVDIYALHDPEGGDQIDGALGDGSQFHSAFGYYAHGVSDATAKPPRGWQDRVRKVEVELTAGPRRGETAVAWCLEAHDLVLSKAVANRERDWEYIEEAISSGIVQADVLLARTPDLPVPQTQEDQIGMRISAIASRLSKQ